MIHLSFAPLEGLTDDVYRRAHAAEFGGADVYYTPFYTTVPEGLTARDRREISAALSAPGAPPTVVQLLSSRASDFLRAAAFLAGCGCTVLNLNLGCPSGTVTAKGRGAGFLAKPAMLDAFFDEVFSGLSGIAPQIQVSVKTRIGYADENEAPYLMEIFNRYPIVELILHPRLRTDLYRGRPRMSVYRQMAGMARMPVCYNGDIFRAEDLQDLLAAFPDTHRVMLGRGAAANPALFRLCRAEPVPDLPGRLRRMHDRICEENAARMGNGRNLLCRMAELWKYQAYLFSEDPRPFLRRLYRCTTLAEYRAAVSALFSQATLRKDAAYPPSPAL